MYQKETPLLIKRSSRFKKNLLEEYKKIKTIDDKIRDQKLQYDNMKNKQKNSLVL